MTKEEFAFSLVRDFTNLSILATMYEWSGIKYHLERIKRMIDETEIIDQRRGLLRNDRR
jgi:hypothetical protein